MVDKHIILALKRLDAEIRRRRTDNRLLHYNTGGKIHLKQLEFHRSPCRIRFVLGGNRSGKTECGAAEAAYLLRGIHPYRQDRRDIEGWVVSLSREVQRDVAQRKLLDYINPEWIEDIVMVSGSKGNPRGGVIDYISVRNVFGGLSRVGFKSCDQGRDKFQGASLDFVWFDEEPPEDIFDECYMRLIDRKGSVFATMTPLKGLTFVYDRFFLRSGVDPEIACISMEWADNPWLDPAEIDRLSAALPEEELERRRYGRFYTAQGLVYKEFDETVHVIDPIDLPHEWYDIISIDPGLRNPLSAHWYAVDGDGVIYVAAEHYEAGRDVKHHSDMIRNICMRLDWHTDGRGRINALIDSAAGQRTLASERSVCDLFYDNGILVNPKVNKDMFAGINRLKILFRARPARIRIFRSCVNLIRELRSYWWGRNDVPEKKDDHALDELRYYIMTKPEADIPAQPKSRIELDKEKRIRRLKKR